MKERLKYAFAILSLGTTVVFLVTPSSTLSMAPDGRSQCYLIPTESPTAAAVSGEEDQIWCYEPTRQPAGATLVYSVDSKGRSSPELSFLVESDGTITHTSLLKGVRTIHRLKAGYNPFNVPLTPPPDAQPVLLPANASARSERQDTLKIFSGAGRASLTAINTLSEGMQTTSVAPESVPWKGFWFPFQSGRLHNGSNSPLAKFDRFVESRTGTSPGAQSWEIRNHHYTGINWEGHCNGWAAASVLRKEPTEPWTDPLSGTTFNVSDIKGIEIENASCVTVAFFGSRYTGRAGENRSDINPVLFHNTISYYLGKLKKPILMDLMSSEEVQNSAVSAYQMDIKQIGANVYKVVATLKVHTYDEQRSEGVGAAPATDRVYSYKLWTNEQGEITEGSWLSANPDFLWVPLAFKTCPYGNPNVTDAWVKKLGKKITLPDW